MLSANKGKLLNKMGYFFVFLLFGARGSVIFLGFFLKPYLRHAILTGPHHACTALKRGPLNSGEVDFQLASLKTHTSPISS